MSNSITLSFDSQIPDSTIQWYIVNAEWEKYDRRLCVESHLSKSKTFTYIGFSKW